jgi:hypothetical protein
MKISFPNCGSGVGISIRAAIAALLNGRKADRAQTGARKKNVPRSTSEWHYRPKETTRAYAAVESAGAETSEVLAPEHFAINNNGWFNDDSLEYAPRTFVSVDPTVGDVTAKAPLSAYERAVSAYD